MIMNNAFISDIAFYASLIRDVGVIIGIPALIGIGVKLYTKHIEMLKREIEMLKHTQYDKALSVIDGQKKLFEHERIELLKKIRLLSESNIQKTDELRKLNTELELVDKKLIDVNFQAVKNWLIASDNIDSSVINVGNLLLWKKTNQETLEREVIAMTLAEHQVKKIVANPSILERPQIIKQLKDENMSEIDLCGTWEIKGSNPEPYQSKYNAKLIISIDNDFLQCEWILEFGQGRSRSIYRGFGILIKNILALTFKSGIAIYEIVSPGFMKGKWALSPDFGIGTEECTKKDKISRELNNN